MRNNQTSMFPSLGYMFTSTSDVGTLLFQSPTSIGPAKITTLQICRRRSRTHWLPLVTLSSQFLVHPADWLQGFSAGLSAVAVALVADAAVRLSKKLCDSKVTVLCCATSAAITFYYQSQWIFPTLIVLGKLGPRELHCGDVFGRTAS